MNGPPSPLARIKHRVHVFLHPRHKIAFLSSIAKSGALLDVGCGNDSPQMTKRVRPDLVYTGVDVCDYEQSNPTANGSCDYRLVAPESFAREIQGLPNRYDAVISSHNLEHCLDPEGVLAGMLRAVKPDGVIYLSFPCAESKHFPSRQGTLNFYDDKTHADVPDFPSILRNLKNSGFEIMFARRRYRPWRRFVIGLILEPLSAMRKKVLRGTWELYGFESIIWARKK